jgi:hypothetical protein
MKNSDDTIGNRTRDLPACRTVPRPTAPLSTRGVPAVQHINMDGKQQTISLISGFMLQEELKINT